MKIVLRTLMMLFLWPVLSVSQEIRQVSVDDAIRIALENVSELRNLRLDEQIQVAKNKEVIGSALPQIALSGQGTYYTNLPKIAFPSSDIGIYQVLEKEGVQDKNGNPINTSNATFGVQPVSFVAPWNYQVGLGVQQLLFQPDVFIAVQAREKVLEFAKENTKVAELRVRESVSKSYYAVLIAQQQRQVLGETLKRLKQLEFEMGQMYKNGFAEKLDLDKLTVTLNNTETAQNQLDNAISISTSLLKNTMGIPQSDSLVLTTKLDPEMLKTELLQARGSFDYSQRPEFTLMNTARELQELDLKRYKLAFAPTLAVFYQLQRSGQRNEIYDVNGSGPWFSFTTGLLGVSLNQTLFDGFQRKNKIQQSKLNIQKIENSLTMLRQAIDMEQNIAASALNSALLNLDVQKRNMQLAETVFNTTKKKYQAGLASSFELIQSDSEFQRAYGNYFQALYEGYVQKISYTKALGKL